MNEKHHSPAEFALRVKFNELSAAKAADGEGRVNEKHHSPAEFALRVKFNELSAAKAADGEVAMKSILIIGMGRFGRHLCKNLADLGNEIMIVDEREENLEELLPYVVSAKIGDCTNEAVLRSLGIANFDLCFVCIGTNFQSSLEITSLVKELGAKFVVSKANRDIHAKFLLRNGADEVIYPDRDIAEKLAVRYSANHIFDYIELTEEYSIYEIPPLPSWVDKSLKESGIRNQYHISVLGTKSGGKANLMPPADYVIQADEHLMVIGKKLDIDNILKELS